MTSSQKKETSRFSIPDGAIIAAAPFVAYLFAFVFEAGYANAFGIPLPLISVGLMNVFIAGGSLLLVGLLLFILSDTVLMLLPEKHGPVLRSLASLFPLFLAQVAVLIYLIGTPRQSSLSWIVGFWVFVLLFEFAFPLLTQRGVATYRGKLKAQEELELAKVRKGLRGAIVRRIGGAYQIFIFLILFLWVTFSAGQSTALKQQEFLVTITSPERVVLRIYGDTIVAVLFDRETDQIEADFKLITVGSDRNPSFRLEHLGPLHLATPTATPEPESTLTPKPSPVVTPNDSSP